LNSIAERRDPLDLNNDELHTATISTREQKLSERVNSQLNSRLSIHLARDCPSEDELDEEFYFHQLQRGLVRASTANLSHYTRKTLSSFSVKSPEDRCCSISEMRSRLSRLYEKYANPSCNSNEKRFKSDLGFYLDSERKRSIARANNNNSQLRKHTSFTVTGIYEKGIECLQSGIEREPCIECMKQCFSHSTKKETAVKSQSESGLQQPKVAGEELSTTINSKSRVVKVSSKSQSLLPPIAKTTKRWRARETPPPPPRKKVDFINMISVPSIIPKNLNISSSKSFSSTKNSSQASLESSVRAFQMYRELRKTNQNRLQVTS
jgi:hypothetical protein